MHNNIVEKLSRFPQFSINVLWWNNDQCPQCKVKWIIWTCTTEYYCTITINSSPTRDHDMPDEIFNSSPGQMACDKVKILSLLNGFSLQYQSNVRLGGCEMQLQQKFWRFQQKMSENCQIWTCVTQNAFVSWPSWRVTTYIFRHVRYPPWCVTDKLIVIVQ